MLQSYREATRLDECYIKEFELLKSTQNKFTIECCSFPILWITNRLSNEVQESALKLTLAGLKQNTKCGCEVVSTSQTESMAFLAF